MDSKLEKKLKKDYPQLFKDMDGDPYRTCMGRGIETGDGWFDIIDVASNEISKIDDQAYFSQIKEKFGSIVLSIDNVVNEKVYTIIKQACEESYKTCEKCGKPGSMNKSLWMRVRCSKHKDDKK